MGVTFYYPSLWSQVPSQSLVPCAFYKGYISLWSHGGGPFQGVPQPLVPCTLPEGTPVLAGGYNCPWWGGGYLSPGLGVTSVPAGGYPRTGIPPSQDRNGVSPSQDRTWDTCTARIGLGYPLAGTGVPPFPAGTGYVVGGMPLAVSSRSTFLLNIMNIIGSIPKMKCRVKGNIR